MHENLRAGQITTQGPKSQHEQANGPALRPPHRADLLVEAAVQLVAGLMPVGLGPGPSVKALTGTGMTKMIFLTGFTPTGPGGPAAGAQPSAR